MKRLLRRNRAGFTLIEAILVMIVIGIAYFGFGYLFGNVTQQALDADLTVVAAKLAREKMDEIAQTKADAGYVSVVDESPAAVSSGSWTFTRSVDTTYVNPADFSNAVSDTGYKRVDITVSWGAGVGEAVTLTTLVTDQVPSAVSGGGGFPPCP